MFLDWEKVAINVFYSQMLLGKCAEREQTTTKDMYEKFGLDLED